MARLTPVLLIYPWFHKRGGIERYLYELASYLKGIDYPFKLVAWDVEEESFRPFWIPIKRPFKLPNFLTALVFSVTASWSLRHLRSTNLTHVQGASLLSQDFVHAHSCHKAWFLHSLATTPRLSKRFFLKLINPLHYLTILIETYQYRNAHCKKVIAISEVIKQELMHAHKVPASKIEVIYNGVNCQEFHPDHQQRYRRPIRSSHGLQESDFVLLFVAHEFKRKGLDTLLKALQLCQDPTLKLIVAGKDQSGPYLPTIDSYGLTQNVVFVGSRRDDLAAYYAASDLFVFPTRYEPFGMVVTEAMSSGLPPLVSRIAGAAELIEDGVDGLLIQDYNDPNEISRKIHQLKNDSALRQRMAQAARAKALQTDWQVVLPQVLALYQKLDVAKEQRLST